MKVLISFVKGKVSWTDAENVILDNHGIGYGIKTVQRTIAKAVTGQEMMLYTHFYVREDTMALYGFETREELSVFGLLLGVNGVGPKAALSVLSTLTVEELYYAVFSDDKKTIARTPGIGPKGAQRMIMELKDKLKMEDLPSISGSDSGHEGSGQTGLSHTDQMTDTIEALVSLGYSNGEAYRAVMGVAGAQEMDAGLLLKKALTVLSV